MLFFRTDLPTSGFSTSVSASFAVYQENFHKIQAMILRFFYSSLKLLAPLRYPQLQMKLVQSSHPTVRLHNCHITLLLFCSFCPSISPDLMYSVGESFRSGPHFCLHCVNTEHVKKQSLPSDGLSVGDCCPLRSFGRAAHTNSPTSD